MDTVIFEVGDKVMKCSYLFYQAYITMQSIIMIVCGWYLCNVVHKRRK